MVLANLKRKKLSTFNLWIWMSTCTLYWTAAKHYFLLFFVVNLCFMIQVVNLYIVLAYCCTMLCTGVLYMLGLSWIIYDMSKVLSLSTPRFLNVCIWNTVRNSLHFKLCYLKWKSGDSKIHFSWNWYIWNRTEWSFY